MSVFKRVVLGISGGVDSAVAGLLLKKKGYDVIGLFMRNWDIKDERGICSVDKDAEDAEWVCSKLRIPFHEANFIKEYWNEVFSYMLEEYQNGRTPNPDIYCNKFVKFNHFLNHAENKYDAQAIATGHYARSSFGDNLEFFKNDKDVRLLQAYDLSKDQTFFLSQVSPSALRKTMFPLGSTNKKTTRRIAEASGLDRIARKEDSTGICFIGKREFSNFIGEYIQEKPGDFVDIQTKEKVGTHHGLHQWTIGQRSKIPGFPWKYFISSKDVGTNTIYVARGSNHPALFCSTLYLDSIKWIHPFPDRLFSNGQLECQFRFQHTKPLRNCYVVRTGPDEKTRLQTSYTVVLQRPMRALTPGQFGVLYKGEECLGSSVILETGPTIYDLNRDKWRTAGVHS